MRALIVAVVCAGASVTMVGAQAPIAQPSNVGVSRVIAWDPLAPNLCEAPCTYEVELDGTVIGTGPLPTIAFPSPPTPGLHTITVVAIDVQGRRSAPSTKTFRETSLIPPAPPTDCPYTPPGLPATTRPIGSTLQGVNPEVGQADRIARLRRDGWAVEWQWDALTRRLFILAECKGLPPVLVVGPLEGV